jgi:hypothetical protein
LLQELNPHLFEKYSLQLLGRRRLGHRQKFHHHRELLMMREAKVDRAEGTCSKGNGTFNILDLRYIVAK